MIVVKEPNCNVIMMSTYSGLVVRNDQKESYILSKVQVLTFKYAEPVARHYFYIGSVDNHNDIRHNVVGG